MSIPLGQLIKQKINEKNMTKSYFGKLINRSKQNVADILKRTSIDSGLLQRISEVLEFDFFSVYYQEEGFLKNNREKEMNELRSEIARLNKELLEEKKTVARLERDNETNRIAIESNQKTVLMLEEAHAKYNITPKPIQEVSPDTTSDAAPAPEEQK
jgi:predicted RNase H-like nuclease (RuvC/YqgF family)